MVPAFTFTIPSIHDDIDLDCRLYLPPISVLAAAPQSPSAFSASSSGWHVRGAVVAHPYAPLGGSQDDWVVEALVEETVRRGFVVGTFNFRGAPGSKGSTSWAGTAELQDYISFAGLLLGLLQCLRSNLGVLEQVDGIINPETSVTTGHDQDHISSSDGSRSIILLLSGYSYGALTTTRLPSTAELLSRVKSPAAPGTAMAEIVLRAQSLADEVLKSIRSHREENQDKLGRIESRGRTSEQHMHAIIAMGGEEGAPGTRRTSHDAETAPKLSVDAIRKSIDRSRRSIDRSRQRLLRRGPQRMGSGGRQKSQDVTERESPSDGGSDEEHGFSPTKSRSNVPSPKRQEAPKVETFYLLVSPLLGPIAAMATVFTSHRPSFASLSSLLHRRGKDSNHPQSHPVGNSPKSDQEDSAKADNQSNLTANPTLAIYGSDDFFTSAKRLRKWCAELSQASHIPHPNESRAQSGPGRSENSAESSTSTSPLFRHREVSGAGHFWREEGAMTELRRAVGGWIEDVVIKDTSVEKKMET